MTDLHDPHTDHDDELVAALLDRAAVAPGATTAATTSAERSTAETWIATCTDCAALHADLLALSTATRELAVPARPRDFRLTAADVARLVGSAGSPAREPSPAAARLTGVMNDTRDHASHDTLLVASLADRTVADRERAVAETLVATCSLCATLHSDLVALTAATRSLPTPTRIRDYRLTPDDAVRLRPSGWRRLIAAFGSPRDVFSRPLAVGLTTLGLAGLLVASVPAILTGGSAASAPATRDQLFQATGEGPGEAASPDGDVLNPVGAAAGTPPMDRSAAAAVLPSNAPNAAVESGRDIVNTGAGETVDVTNGIDRMDDLYVQSGDLAGEPDRTLAAESSGISTVVVVSGMLLLVGLGLFALRWSARRLGDD